MHGRNLFSTSKLAPEDTKDENAGVKSIQGDISSPARTRCKSNTLIVRLRIRTANFDGRVDA
jgi:hypothetical protein